ncbi:MAG: hypothetical protein IGS38_00095 [Synechococcales cyanobacterium M58_A2018_015]|nr:hypothetical protein [Synechococcales cyanobacterium M58_A2018_015]
METLAYLSVAQDYEAPETKKLDLSALKGLATAGLVVAGATLGSMSVAEEASAHYYRGYYRSYRPHFVSYRRYYPRHIYAYPVYYGRRHPCYYY